MKSTKILILILASLLISSFAGAAGAEARHFSKRFQGHGMVPGMAGLRSFIDLGLSESQQTKMKSIMDEHRSKRVNLMDDIKKARKDLSMVLETEPFNEEDARNAFKKVSAIREEMFLLRAKMIADLKSLLTPEQRERLKERNTRRLERFKDS